MPIITIASNKGGVAKTTSAVAIAHGLTLHPSQPLVRITDFDRQAHAGLAMGLDAEPGVYNYLVNRQPLPTLLRPTRRPRLELLPGNSLTETAQDVVNRIKEIADIPTLVRQIAADTDILVIDTQASGYLQELAIAVADIIISPTRPEYLSVDGLHQSVSMIQQLNSTAQLYTIPCCYKGHINEHVAQWNFLKATYPAQSFNCVPERIAVVEAAAEGKTIWESKARGMEDVQAAYRFLINRILGG